MNKTILTAILAIIILGVVYLILPPSNTGNVKQYAENEAVMKHQIKELQKERETLTLKVQKDSIEHIKAIDLAAKSTERVEVVRVIYKQARQKTDQNPDSLNLANEVRESRIMVDTLESHVNALLVLIKKGDDRIKSQADLIATQRTELLIWPKLVENMKAEHKAELKQERKKGNKKLVKGTFLGAAITVVLILL